MTHSLKNKHQFSDTGFPIFQTTDNIIIKVNNLQEYYTLLSNNDNNLSQWIATHPQNILNEQPTLINDQENIAYQHFIFPASFQYMMEKHLFGYAHLIINNSVLVFANNTEIKDILYKSFGRKYKSINLFDENNYLKFQTELLDAYTRKLIDPIFSFNDTSYSFINDAIILAKAQKFNFLNKNTKLSFN